MTDQEFEHHFGSSPSSAEHAPGGAQITREQAEAIARAPWAYASADITRALEWAIKSGEAVPSGRAQADQAGRAAAELHMRLFHGQCQPRPWVYQEGVFDGLNGPEIARFAEVLRRIAGAQT